MRELRNHAMIAMSIGCGLRTPELLALRLEWIQQTGRASIRPGRIPGDESRLWTPFQRSVCGGPAVLMLTADTSLR
jgi:hypothetical protein